MIDTKELIKLLRILDLSVEEQYDWFEKLDVSTFMNNGVEPDESAYELAFRLRDKLKHEDVNAWLSSCWYVTHWCRFKTIEEPVIDKIQARINAEHYVLACPPIYWLVAVHIARLWLENGK